MKLSECRMSFTEALEQWMTAREELRTAPIGCRRCISALESQQEAEEHLNAMTQLATVAEAVRELSMPAIDRGETVRNILNTL